VETWNTRSAGILIAVILDCAAFRLENGLKRLIEALQEMRRNDENWEDEFIVRESNTTYGSHTQIESRLDPRTLEGPVN
jgi:hypothetical protein